MAKILNDFKSKLRIVLLFLIFLTASSIFSSCSSYSFIKTGNDQNYTSKPTDCDIQLVSELPSIQLVEIGIWVVVENSCVLFFNSYSHIRP